jgi:hypothetical protein
MSRFPRYLRRQLEAEDKLKVDQLVRDAEELPEQGSVAAGATAAGDARRLRGIPDVSRGTSGAIDGTDPLKALLAREGGRRR